MLALLGSLEMTKDLWDGIAFLLTLWNLSWLTKIFVTFVSYACIIKHWTSWNQEATLSQWYDIG